MNILLIQPPLNKNLLGAGSAYLTEPLALEAVAASLPERHSVTLLDMRIDPCLDNELARCAPGVAGITGNTTDVYTIIDTLKKIKSFNKDIVTVVGGHHATMMPYDFDKEFVDIVVIGEGEITFREILDAVEDGKDLSNVNGIAFKDHDGKRVVTAPRLPLSDLDAMPFPRRELTERYRQKYYRGNWRPIASLMTSKGCPFRCNFCALWKINGGKYCMRSAASVADELETITEKYVDFAEDNALHSIPRAQRLYEIIKERNIKKTYKLYGRSDTIVKHPAIIEKWKEIGMDLLLVGLESFRDNELSGLRKSNTVRNNEEAVRILQANDVGIAAYFIVFPDYDKDDFKALGDYVERLRLRQPVFTVLTPLPGTDLYREKYSRLTTHNYELYDFVHCVLPTKLPLDEFYNCLIELYRRCYASEGKNGLVSSNKIFEQARTVLASAHGAERVS